MIQLRKPKQYLQEENKMKNAKRFLAAALAATLVLSMSACGSTTDSQKAEGTQTSNDTAKAVGEATTSERAKLTMFVDEAWWPYDTWNGAIPEEFNKRANVDIQVTRAADDKQLPMLVASGDLPDLIDSYRYQYLANDKTCIPFDTLQSQYPDVKFPVHSVLQFVNKASDGHYYSIGCGYSPNSEYKKYDKILTEGPGFFYREDIAKELGLNFNSLADLDTAFAKVKTAHPEMSPVAFNYIHGFGWLKQMMGVPTSNYYNEDGNLVWYIRAKKQLEYYKKVNEWYRLGYISADNFAFQTEDDTQKMAVSGKAFAVFGYDNHADNYNTAVKANGGNFNFKLVTDVISDKAQKYDSFAGGRGLYITKSSKNVEAAYKTVAYAYGDEGMKLLMWGIEGEDYTLDSKGYPTFKYDFQGDNSVLQPRGLKYWGWLVHNAIVTGIADANSSSQTAQARISLTKYVKHDPVIGMIRFATDSEESVINNKLSEMIKAEEARILMADSEQACEAAYNDMIKKADSIGMAKLEKYGNETYTKLKPEYEKIADNAE